ncbi:sugar transferase [Pararhizobium sp. YC-54]|uniref:sugar transferase n=1 Tax=Pararhizobium sp. YC-54 TaxID=2986920 RepID=UPI0021F7ECAB|nr:sugar transferase [Pararhizobium sp. YC-54]MCV9997889.1 sugar transferase [Pararhizobium sp. YC-54]
MLQRPAPIRTKDSGPGKARATILPANQSRAAGSDFHVNPARLPNVPSQFAVKRAIDAISAAFGLVILAPVFLVIAVLIKLDSKGPVFARQLHTGLDGAPFELLTFRCTHTGPGGFDSTNQPVANDPRFTPLGHLLNRRSLDALPRLWNVLAGDMSLVGPRPHVPDMLAAGRSYSDLVQGYEYRHLMRPGLTGLARSCGSRGPAGPHWMAIRQIVCDVDYVRQFSLLLDMKIILRTAIHVLKGKTSP